MASSLSGAPSLAGAATAVLRGLTVTGAAGFGADLTVAGTSSFANVSCSGWLTGNGALLTHTPVGSVNASNSIGVAGVATQLSRMVGTLIDPAQTETFSGAACSPTLHLWAIVGGVGQYSISGTGIGLYTSPDGVTWTARVSPSVEMWSSVAWGNGRFVAVSQYGPANGTTYSTMTSTDGINWTGHVSPYQQISRVIYNPDRAEFLAVGLLGFAVSTDGIIWSTPLLPLAGGNFLGVAWSKSLALYAAITHDVSGNGQSYPFTSPDGITWTQRQGTSTGGTVFTLCWSPVLNLFVAIGQYKWYWSRDGITWTWYLPKCAQGAALSPTQSARCIWDPDHSVFVAAGDSTGGLAISADGFGWEHVNPPAGFITAAGGGFVEYSSALGQLLAVSASTSQLTPYPIVFTASFSGSRANVTQSTGTGFLGVGLGAVAPIQQLDVGGYVRAQHPYFVGTGVAGAATVTSAAGGYIGSQVANLVTVGNACVLGGYQQSFFAPADCVASVSCCANIGPGGYLQLTKTSLTSGMVAQVQVAVMSIPVSVVAQNTNFGATYGYVSVAATVPMIFGEQINARSNASIFDGGASFSGAMLFAT